MTLKALVSFVANRIRRRKDKQPHGKPAVQRPVSEDRDGRLRERDESFYWDLWLHRHW